MNQDIDKQAVPGVGERAELPARERLKGKVAIVTGAGSSGPGFGTGKAISVLFAREGAKVVLVDAVAERAEETRAIIERAGGTAVVVRGNVIQRSDCELAVNRAIECFGKLDILVNNAGINRPSTLLELREGDWDDVLGVNLKAMLLMSQQAVRNIAAEGGGAIVNISSISAAKPSGGSHPYSASKGGVEALTRSLAVECGPFGIRVNAVAPGQIYTPMVASTNRTLCRATNLLGKEGDAWDVAYAVLFLAGDEARWISGQVLTVDGGYTTAPTAWAEKRQSDPLGRRIL
jgi:NAD(P)-dependent dehydrogenase (short-subunit alcohol dehydrogenase family)